MRSGSLSPWTAPVPPPSRTLETDLVECPTKTTDGRWASDEQCLRTESSPCRGRILHTSPHTSRSVFNKGLCRKVFTIWTTYLWGRQRGGTTHLRPHSRDREPQGATLSRGQHVYCHWMNYYVRKGQSKEERDEGPRSEFIWCIGVQERVPEEDLLGVDSPSSLWQRG